MVKNFHSKKKKNGKNGMKRQDRLRSYGMDKPSRLWIITIGQITIQVRSWVTLVDRTHDGILGVIVASALIRLLLNWIAKIGNPLMRDADLSHVGLLTHLFLLSPSFVIYACSFDCASVNFCLTISLFNIWHFFWIPFYINLRIISLN